MENGLVHNLVGITLNGGWKVVQKIEKEEDDTGGNFSVCYIVENNKSERAFLKALNFEHAMRKADPNAALYLMTQAFRYEQEVLQKCKNANLDRVVVAIDQGVYRPDTDTPEKFVQYIVFELADGNIRKKMDFSKSVDLAYNLRALHHIAVGVQQIHGQGIAHQDLKPSNILVFERINKIADFGRSSYLNHIAPHEDFCVAGDPTYAPIEQLYGYQSPEWNVRRLGTDLYHLGSLIHYVFTGTMLTPAILDRLPPELHPYAYGGDYTSVLPYIKNVMSEVVNSFSLQVIPQLRKEFPQMLLELSNPDPEKRGVSRGIGTPDQYALDRYISRFDFYARYAEANIINKLRS